MSPPTDNLYKFLAVSGILLIGFTAVAPFRDYYETQDIYARNARDEKVALAEWRKAVASKRSESGFEKDMGKIEDAVIKALKDKKDSESVQQIVEIKLDRLKKLTEEAKDATLNVLDADKLLADVNYHNQQTELLGSRSNWLLGLSVAGFSAGVLMSAFGFLRWYLLFQRLADAVAVAGMKEFRKADGTKSKPPHL